MSKKREVDPSRLDAFAVFTKMVREGLQPLPQSEAQELAAEILQPIRERVLTNVSASPQLSHGSLRGVETSLQSSGLHPSPFLLATETAGAFAHTIYRDHLAEAVAADNKKEIRIYTQAIAGTQIVTSHMTEAEDSLREQPDANLIAQQHAEIHRLQGFDPEPERLEENVRNALDSLAEDEDSLIRGGISGLVTDVVARLEETPAENLYPLNKEFAMEGVHLAVGLFELFYQEAITGRYKQPEPPSRE